MKRNRSIDKKRRHRRNQRRGTAGEKRGSGTSSYARKEAWLAEHGKWGWEVPEPKPWK